MQNQAMKDLVSAESGSPTNTSSRGTRKGITNITVGSFSPHSQRAAVAWHMDGARFHVWVNVEKKLPLDSTLYKNPLVDYKQPGYFDTRHLDLEIQKNADIFARVLAEAESKGLFAAAIAAYEAEERVRMAKNAAAIREARIKENGPELLKALTDLLQVADEVTAQQGWPDNTVRHAARAAIARATGSES